jgi:DNA repair photolyase
MHTHLGGACPHRCSYCYVQAGVAKISGKYVGPVRLLEKELSVNYGEGKTIFIEHMNDLFAYPGVWDLTIGAILGHVCRYPNNQYIFQTKNPARAWGYRHLFPPSYMIGTTIETNRDISVISKAPGPSARASGLALFSGYGIKTFITIEPIMDFDVNVFPGLIVSAKPSFVNIGADSKGCGLAEPSADKIIGLVELLTFGGVVIRKKTNLSRILGN